MLCILYVLVAHVTHCPILNHFVTSTVNRCTKLRLFITLEMTEYTFSICHTKQTFPKTRMRKRYVFNFHLICRLLRKNTFSLTSIHPSHALVLNRLWVIFLLLEKKEEKNNFTSFVEVFVK